MPFTTRVAPSPTGDMHLGTARTAYFNWLVAHATGGRFLLRVDDTDLERNREECVEVIHQSMDWLGIKPDFSFRQSHRKSIYDTLSKALVDTGSACVLDNGAIALRWSDAYPRTWHDEIAGDIPITDTNVEQIDKKLILVRGGEKLGQPTYQFCSVVDDWDMGVNYIIRGVDHTTNTPKQIAIWEALNATILKGNWRTLPKFAHIGLIFKDKKKLSKRDNAASMLFYKAEGYSPEVMLNFMLRLGWSPKDGNMNGFISKDEAVKLFLEAGKMRNSNANMDLAKLAAIAKAQKHAASS